MAKEYNVGDRLYLPVWVTEKETNVMMGPDKSTTITDTKFSYAYWHGKTGEGKVRYGEDGLLLTATEIAENVAGRRCAECSPMYEELKARNAELEALLKEVMATRDEAIKQNNELIAENKKLKADCNEWKDTADDRIVDVQNLTAERDNLKADLATQKEVNEELKAKIAELTAWYEEANKTASEAAEANDDLKAKIADLRNRVGEQLAQIQDLNAEVRFLKEKSGKQTEEATKHAHVVLNDGTGYNFLECTKASFDNYADFSVLKIYRGEEYVAGFLRGDKPMNLAYWWTE